MDILRNSLNIIFHRISPQIIINEIFKEDLCEDVTKSINKNAFLKEGHLIFNNYSDDELINIYNKTLDDMKEGKCSTTPSIFNLLWKFTSQVLIESDHEPICRYEYMLRWKMLSHELGQDILTTSYLAYKDVATSVKRYYFTWKPIINTDNIRLKNMLKKGIAENHFHLKGSSITFELSWINIMNSPIGRDEQFNISKIDENRLNPDINIGKVTNDCENMYSLVKKAAYIRLLLFTKLNHIDLLTYFNTVDRNYIIALIKNYNGSTLKLHLKEIGKWDYVNRFCNNEYKLDCKKTGIDLIKSLNEMNLLEHIIQVLSNDINSKNRYLYNKRLLKEEDLDIELNKIDNLIDIMQYEYGYEFNFNSFSQAEILDYAIPKNIIRNNNNINLILLGERRFLYMMFKKIYAEDNILSQYSGLFYIYLSIKAKFRSEIIQNNKRVGFKNFSDYEVRKTVFIEGNPSYEKLLYRMAISATVNNQSISNLEARITPASNEIELERKIKQIDRIIENDNLINYSKAELQEKEINNLNYNINKNNADNNKSNLDKFFYTVHFVKNRQEFSKNEIEEFCIPRNYDLRRTVKQKAIVLSNIRENKSSISKRILGIDACANEIGARPEAFAQAFRYLKNHIGTHKLDYLNESIILPQIHATYHAGEDFLDIVDGLRAIDETIKFLNFRHGDRIGHALALGINVDKYYKFKNYTLIMPKQDYLDNIVWLMSKIEEYNLVEKYGLLEKLDNKFNYLFQEIHISNYNDTESKLGYTHNDYYNSWKLRGDDPMLYFDSYDTNNDFYKNYKNKSLTFWDECSVSDLIDKYLRNNKKAISLYYNYHFNPKIKLKGSEQIEVKIKSDYIDAVRDVQKIMQREIAVKGIGIECNPSSNYLIGTFNKYSEHPIVNFYNLGLTINKDEIQRCPQLFVSINTDDQGVFSTDLENEYALMAIALEKELNIDGSRHYNQAMIYEWLDKIRQMGIEQSFNNN